MAPMLESWAQASLGCAVPPCSLRPASKSPSWKQGIVSEVEYVHASAFQYLDQEKALCMLTFPADMAEQRAWLPGRYVSLPLAPLSTHGPGLTRRQGSELDLHLEW